MEANNLKSQSQQEGMWLEAQVNLYNMWTPIGKSDVKMFFQLISCLFTYWHICKQRVKKFFSPSSKKRAHNPKSQIPTISSTFFQIPSLKNGVHKIRPFLEGNIGKTQKKIFKNFYCPTSSEISYRSIIYL